MNWGEVFCSYKKIIQKQQADMCTVKADFIPIPKQKNFQIGTIQFSMLNDLLRIGN
jgi:hypothetical protein